MKFIDYNSTEKAIINNTFKSIPYMDMWISSIVEGYIYEKVDKTGGNGYREECMLRYGKLEGKGKQWWENGQLRIQEYYKDGKLEGEHKEWWKNGQICQQEYYKEGKREGEAKDWYSNGQISIQCYYKEGLLEGEYKEWNKNGQLLLQCYYKEGKPQGSVKFRLF
jgi:antitoxin component YwqK of YwqJK toxin-antitoxin module